MKYPFILLIILPFYLSAQPIIKDINKAAYKAITLPKEPDFLAADGNTAWVVDNNNNRVQKISATSNKPLLIDTINGACAAPVIAYNAVWVVSCTEKQLYKLDKNTGKVLAKIPTGVADDNGEIALAAGDGSIWILTDSSGMLSRIDANTNKIVNKIAVKPHSYCAVFGFGAVWVSNYMDSSIQRINITSNTVTATMPVGSKPRFITAGARGVWTLNQGNGTVTHVNPTTNQAIATIDVKAPGGGGDITAGSCSVWVVSTNKERPLQEIDATTNTIKAIYLQPQDEQKVKVDGAARAAGQYIWVSNMYSKTVWAIKLIRQ